MAWQGVARRGPERQAMRAKVGRGKAIPGEAGRGLTNKEVFQRGDES